MSKSSEVLPLIARLKDKILALLPQEEQQSEDDLITIATFQPVMQPHAELLRSRLEAEDIWCIINGQAHARADFVRLQIQRADLAKARIILAETEKG